MGKPDGSDRHQREDLWALGVCLAAITDSAAVSQHVIADSMTVEALLPFIGSPSPEEVDAYPALRLLASGVPPYEPALSPWALACLQWVPQHRKQTGDVIALYYQTIGSVPEPQCKVARHDVGTIVPMSVAHASRQDPACGASPRQASNCGASSEKETGGQICQVSPQQEVSCAAAGHADDDSLCQCSGNTCH